MGSGEEFSLRYVLAPFKYLIEKVLDLGWGGFCIRGGLLVGEGIIRYLPKTMISIPNMETLHSL